MVFKLIVDIEHIFVPAMEKFSKWDEFINLNLKKYNEKMNISYE